MLGLLGAILLLAAFATACGSESQRPSSSSPTIHTAAEVQAAFADADIRLSRPYQIDEKQVFFKSTDELETWFTVAVLRDAETVAQQAALFHEGQTAGREPFINQSFVAQDNLAVIYDKSASTEKVDKLMDTLESLD